MNLSPLGANVSQRGAVERLNIGHRLLQDEGIRNYVHQGVCYDAVAFTKFLLGAPIDVNSLLNLYGPDWKPVFNFLAGRLWLGEPIDVGTAVGFQYVHNGDIFHTSIALGGHRIRGENGHRLGNGWISIGDSDLSRLEQVSRGVYRLPNENVELRVWLSFL